MISLFDEANNFSKSLSQKDKTTHSLQEQMIYVYEQKATSELLKCFSEDRLPDTLKLTEFLKANWERTRFSCVGYTARPNAPFTQLLCRAAKELAGNANGLDVLMPGIQAHDYGVEQNEPPLEDSLETLAHDHGGEQNDGSYVALSAIDLPQLLRTHIIGDGGNYLVPVAHIARLAEGILGRDEGMEWNMNPYYTSELNAEAAFLSPNEIGRLWHHSPESRALQQTMNELIHAQTEEPTLLSQLQTLYKQLSLNDAHGGVGSNDKAGEAVYSAITNFFTYYDKLLLDDAIAKSIPEDIKVVLTTLRNFASNKDATGNSCIGLRAEALKPLITTHSERLKSITIDSIQLSSTIETAQENYDNALALVRTPLDTNNTVSDKLAFTNELINWLDFPIALENQTDLDFFMRMPTKDMKIIIENPSIPKQLSKLVERGKVDLINLFTSGYELDNIRLVLDCLMKLDHNSAAFFSPQALKQAFFALSDRQAILLAELLLDNKQMNGEVSLFLFENKEESFKNQLLEHLPAFINNGRQLTDILDLLNKTPVTADMGLLKHNLLAIITDGTQLTSILRLVDSTEQERVIVSLKQKLPEIITDATQLADILDPLHITTRTEVISLFKKKFPEIIKDGMQLANFLWQLNKMQGSLVDFSLKNRASSRTLTSFHDLYETQISAVMGSLKPNVHKLITDTTQLASILRLLNKTRITAVMGLLKQNVPKIITNAQQLIDTFKYLNHSQTYSLLMSVKDHLPAIIFDAKEYLSLCSLMDNRPITPFNEAFNKLLPTLITNTDQLRTVLNASGSKRLIVFNEIASNAIGLAFLQKIPHQELVTLIGNEGIECMHLKQMLHQIKQKSDELGNAGASDKAYYAKRLYEEVNESFNTYQNSSKLKDDYIRFQNKCNREITVAQDSTLKEHRGWKKIFTNLLIGVASLGVAFIANTIRTGGKQVLFNINTDSEKKTNQLKTALHAIISSRESPSSDLDDSACNKAPSMNE